MKKILSLILCLVMLACGVVSAAAAEGNVTYSGDAGDFVFEPGTEHSVTDLFPDLKNVMPGDTLSQQIQVRNDASNQVKVKIYVRSLGAHEESAAFLSQLQLLVEQDGDSVLFEAAADQPAQLTDWVCLGTLLSGGTVDLDVTLYVPQTLGNEFQNAAGYLDWEFMVEEYPIEPEDPQPPKTGDETPIGLYMGIMAVSAVMLGILVLMMVMRKKKEEHES
ncbi:MAG: sortase B protein-sorting domain-containing protein [Oscillospiraceae bacterium]|nr:sortase B protein-sorting domain-containing protein [Oscillospiraceae bacterium]